MPSVRTLAASRGGRLYIFVAAVVLFLLVFGFRSTDLPSQGKEYVLGLLSKSGGWQLQAGSSADPLATEPLPEGESFAVAEPSPATEVVSPANEPSPAVEPSSTAVAAFSKDKWFFEWDLDPYAYIYPDIDLEALSDYAPHNYRGPGHEAFAAVFTSRNGSMTDPYFVATQQVIYRTLWDPRSKSEKHPIVVFVPAYVPQFQRNVFAAAGALVREISENKYVPQVGLVAGRLKDVFSKLEMWNQTDFTKLAYLDSDAFPIENSDGIFDTAQPQTCQPRQLSEKYLDLPADICDYIFTAMKEDNTGMLNAGVMVLKPNAAMHGYLIREFHDNENFDNGFAEQALVTYVFRQDGPFPSSFFDHAYNSGPDTKQNGEPSYIVHAKLWALFADPKHWAANEFFETWKTMVKFYESAEYRRLRAQDGPLASA